MTPLKQLAEQGQSVWIDYLSRTFIDDGDLAGLVNVAVAVHDLRSLRPELARRY